MYTNDYNKALERIKTAIELAKDMQNYERCGQVLLHYERTEAWKCLQDVIREYHEQIAFCGLPAGYTMYSHVRFEQVSDAVIRDQLTYFGSRISAYVLARESQKELAKRICEWLDRKFKQGMPEDASEWRS